MPRSDKKFDGREKKKGKGTKRKEKEDRWTYNPSTPSRLFYGYAENIIENMVYNWQLIKSLP